MFVLHARRHFQIVKHEYSSEKFRASDFMTTNELFLLFFSGPGSRIVTIIVISECTHTHTTSEKRYMTLHGSAFLSINSPDRRQIEALIESVIVYCYERTTSIERSIVEPQPELPRELNLVTQ